MSAPYAELQVATNFSFLRGASHPEELFAAAAALGTPALDVADRNSLAGRAAGWRLWPGRCFPLRHGRGDEATHATASDPRERPPARPGRDIYIPDLRLGSGIKVPTRDFR